MLARLLRHSSTYTASNALLTVAGFISFPILTRLLSVPDYGVLALVGTTLSLEVSLGKLGIQQSIVRFHAEIFAGDRAVSRRRLVSTVFWGMAATGLVATLMASGTTFLVPRGWWSEAKLRPLLLATSVLIVVRVLDSAFQNILRAEQRSLAFMLYNVIRRYALLAFALVTMLYVLPGLNGFYASTIVGEVIALVILGAVTVGRGPARTADFSPQLMRSMLAFGLPMMAYEVAGTLLNVGDRYVVQGLLGSASQGIYSAAYSLDEYVQSILIDALTAALVPIYTKLWVERGSQEAGRFIGRVLHFYVLLGAAIVAGLAVVGNELISELATERYRSHAAVIPLIMTGLVFEGAMPIVGAGLFLNKQTGRLLPLVVVCALLNVVVSLILVPRLGLVGAAASMLLSYILLLIGFARLGGALLRIPIPWAHMAKCTVLAGVMYLAIREISISNTHWQLAVQVLAGAVTYGALALMVDRPSRELLQSARRRLLRADQGT